MGATLRYAKVVDRDYLQAHGGLSPSIDNVVVLTAPAPAAAREFLVLRAWDDVTSGFEEQWRIEDAHGRTIYTGAPRGVLAQHGDLSDEVAGVAFEYRGTGYQLVLSVDDREVARTDFTVAEPNDPQVPPPPPSPADEISSAAQATVADSEAQSALAAPKTDEPVVRSLSDTEQRALDSVTRLEMTGTPGFVHTIAEHAGLDLSTTRAALSGLTGLHDLVQEVSTGAGDGPDLGPRYRVKARP